MARSALLTVMIRAAEKAARGLKRDFGEVEHLQVSRKGPGDFVSIADKKAEDTIKEELTKARPDYAWIGEETGESGNKDAEFCWIVDPLDGTTNFLHGMPHWSISIACVNLKKNEVVAGAVYDPIKDEMFFAEKGAGAFLNSRRLRVSSRREAEDALVVYGISPGQMAADADLQKRVLQLGNKVANTRRMGSAALDLAYVAAGRYEFFTQPMLKTWDFAAGQLLVTEAAGKVTRLDGAAMTIEHGSICASNNWLHDFALTELGNVPQDKRKVAP